MCVVLVEEMAGTELQQVELLAGGRNGVNHVATTHAETCIFAIALAGDYTAERAVDDWWTGVTAPSGDNRAFAVLGALICGGVARTERHAWDRSVANQGSEGCINVVVVVADRCLAKSEVCLGGVHCRILWAHSHVGGYSSKQRSCDDECGAEHLHDGRSHLRVGLDMSRVKELCTFRGLNYQLRGIDVSGTVSVCDVWRGESIEAMLEVRREKTLLFVYSYVLAVRQSLIRTCVPRDIQSEIDGISSSSEANHEQRVSESGFTAR